MIPIEIEKDLREGSSKNIPNGYLLYVELTDYIFEHHKNITSITEQLMDDISDKMMSIADNILNHRYRIETVDMPVYCGYPFILIEGGNVLAFEVWWDENWMSDTMKRPKKHHEYIYIPINLDKPLRAFWLDRHISDMTSELSSEIDRHIIETMVSKSVKFI